MSKKVNDAQKGPTPGAGVDPIKVVVARKRLRKQFSKEGDGRSFRVFVRSLAEDGDENAKAWLAHKSRAYTAEARKERAARVGVLRAAAKAKAGTGKSKKK